MHPNQRMVLNIGAETSIWVLVVGDMKSPCLFTFRSKSCIWLIMVNGGDMISTPQSEHATSQWVLMVGDLKMHQGSAEYASSYSEANTAFG